MGKTLAGLLLVLAGCGQPPPVVDAGQDAGRDGDAGQVDAGPPPWCGLGTLPDGGKVGDLPDGGEYPCPSGTTCRTFGLCCPPETFVRNQACVSIYGSCFDGSECADPILFFCNTTTSACRAACRKAADCSAAVRGDLAILACAGGCYCDAGTCVP